jgi:hypothetical protein
LAHNGAVLVDNGVCDFLAILGAAGGHGVVARWLGGLSRRRAHSPATRNVMAVIVASVKPTLINCRMNFPGCNRATPLGKNAVLFKCDGQSEKNQQLSHVFVVLELFSRENQSRVE